MGEKFSLKKKLIVASFISVPILSSFISMFHIVGFMNLGNYQWMSWMLAVAFELGSIASFMSLSVLKKLNKGMVWSMFYILFFMQLVGNIYFSFDFVNTMLATNPNFLASFTELVSVIYEVERSTSKLILSLLVAVPIPVISIISLKSLVQYVDDEEIEILEEAPKVFQASNLPEILTQETPQTEEDQEILDALEEVEKKLEIPPEEIKEEVEKVLETPLEKIEEEKVNIEEIKISKADNEEIVLIQSNPILPSTEIGPPPDISNPVIFNSPEYQSALQLQTPIEIPGEIKQTDYSQTLEIPQEKPKREKRVPKVQEISIDELTRVETPKRRVLTEEIGENTIGKNPLENKI